VISGAASVPPEAARRAGVKAMAERILSDEEPRPGWHGRFAADILAGRTGPASDLAREILTDPHG